MSKFKMVDVAPIMVFDGLARPVPTTVFFQIEPSVMGGKNFHIIVYTKVVDGVQTLGGTNYWTPEELKENVLRVGTLQADARAFKNTIQASLIAGGITPQPTVNTPPVDPIVPVQPNPLEHIAEGDDAQTIVDDLGI